MTGSCVCATRPKGRRDVDIREGGGVHNTQTGGTHVKCHFQQKLRSISKFAVDNTHPKMYESHAWKLRWICHIP